jgi:hypothetical protein
MLAIKDATMSQSYGTTTAAATRKLLLSAQAGQMLLLDLEKMQLNDVEVAKFLTRQIPVMRAAAYGGGFETLGVFLEEFYYCLRGRIENAAQHLPLQNGA